MRRWLLDLHLYLGLLCLPYLVVFGVSSILLNHGVRSETRTEWQREIALMAANDKAAAADSLDALGLTGSVLAHTVKRDAAGALRFTAIRPGRSYQVELAANGQASVRELRGACSASRAICTACTTPGVRRGAFPGRSTPNSRP